ncbi:MAG: response regulator transcription factor [Alphaproteobacteria bacterium]|nr:MAG: response regulator transcription factor [Alphaproteobacteria bacterium]TMJ40387.1 MAG: response regulator transcription factor [Alphaproteobacteria bacterium]
MPGYRVIIVDDHPLFRAALKQALSGAFKGIKLDEAGTLDAVTARLDRDSDVDLVLLDLKMPGVQGLSGLMFLRAQYPAVSIAVVSASDQPHIIRRALDLGASGFIPKSLAVEDMRRAIASILAGGIWAPEGLGPGAAPDSEGDALAQRVATLTPQQMRVLMMLKEGLLNKQIAFQLGISEATIKAHVSAILQKLAVGSRTQAVIAANRIDGESHVPTG